MCTKHSSVQGVTEPSPNRMLAWTGRVCKLLSFTKSGWIYPGPPANVSRPMTHLAPLILPSKVKVNSLSSRVYWRGFGMG